MGVAYFVKNRQIKQKIERLKGRLNDARAQSLALALAVSGRGRETRISLRAGAQAPGRLSASLRQSRPLHLVHCVYLVPRTLCLRRE